MPQDNYPNGPIKPIISLEYILDFTTNSLLWIGWILFFIGIFQVLLIIINKIVNKFKSFEEDKKIWVKNKWPIITIVLGIVLIFLGWLITIIFLLIGPSSVPCCYLPEEIVP